MGRQIGPPVCSGRTFSAEWARTAGETTLALVSDLMWPGHDGWWCLWTLFGLMKDKTVVEMWPLGWFWDIKKPQKCILSVTRRNIICLSPTHCINRLALQNILNLTWQALKLAVLHQLWRCSLADKIACYALRLTDRWGLTDKDDVYVARWKEMIWSPGSSPRVKLALHNRSVFVVVRGKCCYQHSSFPASICVCVFSLFCLLQMSQQITIPPKKAS